MLTPGGRGPRLWPPFGDPGEPRLWWGFSTVIHFSTAAHVHSCAAVDQHVYRNYPQAYAQNASLADPGLA